MTRLFLCKRKSAGRRYHRHRTSAFPKESQDSLRYLALEGLFAPLAPCDSNKAVPAVPLFSQLVQHMMGWLSSQAWLASDGGNIIGRLLYLVCFQGYSPQPRQIHSSTTSCLQAWLIPSATLVQGSCVNSWCGRVRKCKGTYKGTRPITKTSREC